MNNKNEVLITTLPSGLRVASKHMHGVETISFGVFVDVGARYEDETNNGVSHFLEHMAFKGTSTRSAQDIAIEFDSIGGHLNAYTSMEQTVYYAKVLKENIEDAVDIISDILQNSVFDAGELDKEREVILQEIAMHKDTPDDLVFDYFQQTAFPNQPLGRSILGTSKLIESYNRDDLIKYLKRHYTANKMVVVAAGNIEHNKILDLASRAFERFKSDEIVKPVSGNYVGGDIRKQQKLEQLHMVMGFDGMAYTDERYPALQVMSTALGGGMSSRLFQEIREKRGLAYSVYSFTISYRDSGIFCIYGGTSEKQGSEFIKVVSDEVENFAKNISDAEISRAKAQIKAGILMSLESTSSQLESVGRSVLIYNRYRTPEELIGKVDAVTKEQMVEILNQSLSSPRTFTVLGEIKSLKNV